MVVGAGCWFRSCLEGFDEGLGGVGEELDEGLGGVGEGFDEELGEG